ncbi:GtrA family protein [Sinomonas sp. JGH33]|uniref:GtrA family protein n=1 Tax=Sinomonas terricola TaxID=3110330 RepID=A0ABU5T5Q7_9MICC|nr:GtrA family protein [Sinomonas sp. JGH33]MEA5454872.1 GtrA family protein [Sinomonas sp. JGH33]
MGRLARFAAVGASGVLVNLGALALLLMAHVGSRITGGEALSAIMATQVAIGWNFTLTERWVFTGHRGHWLRRLFPFWALSCATLLAQLPLAATPLPCAAGSAGTASRRVVGSAPRSLRPRSSSLPRQRDMPMPARHHRRLRRWSR